VDRPTVGSVQILRGNALALALADESVDLIVTSPPYFGLRSYQDGGEHYAGQIGDEPTPAEFVDALIAATAEMVRVLKPSGSIWVNLGDKYSGAGRGNNRSAALNNTDEMMATRLSSSNGRQHLGLETAPAKSLMGIPWRYAIRCIDDLGLILRAEVIWSKPNGLPESVTDRVRRSHETWFHFTKEPRYFSAVDEIREAHSEVSLKRAMPHRADPGRRGPEVYGGTANGQTLSLAQMNNPLGKLPGSVWTIPTQPLRVPAHLGVDHFAAFPMEWPRRIIQGWSPSGVCADCGFLLGSTYDSGMLGVRRELRASRAQREGRGSVLLEGVLESAHLAESQVDEVPALDDSGLRGGLEAGSPDGAEVGLPHGAPTGHGRASRQDAGAERGRASQERHQDGQPDRESGTPGEDRARPAAQAGTEALRLPSLRRHDPDVRDALACPHCGGTSLNRPVVADVFGGTGTTALVAKALGRHGISNDMSADYCRLAGWRTTDPKQLAKAARRPFVPPAEQTEGQLDLLEGIA